jgi:hypothetical protein
MAPKLSLPCVVKLFFGVLCLLPVTGLSQTAPEETPTATVTNTPAMAVDVRRGVAGSDMPYRYAFISVGKEKYTFLVPEGYRVDTSDPLKVKLASPDYSSLITLGLFSSSTGGASKMDAETLHAHVLAHHPNATIKSGQTVCVNGETAPALDYIWKTESGITRAARTAFISTSSGLLEFTISASPDQFEAGLAQLNLIALTFRTGSNGKFDYVIGSKYP